MPAGATFFEILELMEKHGAEYVVVGGYALSFNGLTRQTGDVDILVPTTPENNRRWISALSKLPDGAAKELFEIADDPFTVRDAGTPKPLNIVCRSTAMLPRWGKCWKQRIR